MKTLIYAAPAVKGLRVNRDCNGVSEVLNEMVMVNEKMKKSSIKFWRVDTSLLMIWDSPRMILDSWSWNK